MEGQNGNFARYEKPLKIGLVALIVISVALIAVFGFIIPAVQGANQPTTMEFGVAPTAATITVDGDTYTTGVYENFPVGTHTAEITAPGFESKTVEFTVVEHQANTLFTYLYNLEEGLDYFQRSEADLAILSKVDDPTVQGWLVAYNQAVSIQNELPATVRFEYNQPYQYTDIDGSLVQDSRPATVEVELTDGSAMAGCELAFCLWVDTGFVGRDLAAPFVEAQIVEMGYDPSDYYIMYD